MRINRDRVFNGKDFKLYRQETRQINLRNMQTICKAMLCVSTVLLIASLVLGDVIFFDPIFFAFFIPSTGVFLLISYTLVPNHPRMILPMSYFLVGAFLMVAVLSGTFFDPERPGLTYIVFMCILPSFIADSHLRQNLLIIISSTIYCSCCFLSKDFGLAVSDAGNTLIFTAISVITHYYLTNTRLESLKAQSELKHKAETDSLSELFNRGPGIAAVKDLIASDSCGVHAFFLMDIDNFKSINDTYGHAFGDTVIRELAASLMETFPARAVVFRLGGDEFCAFVANILNKDECKRLVSDAQKCFDKHMNDAVEKIEFHLDDNIRVTTGCAVYPEHGRNYDALYENADKAMYSVKHEKAFSFAETDE